MPRLGDLGIYTYLLSDWHMFAYMAYGPQSLCRNSGHICKYAINERIRMMRQRVAEW